MGVPPFWGKTLLNLFGLQITTYIHEVLTRKKNCKCKTAHKITFFTFLIYWWCHNNKFQESCLSLHHSLVGFFLWPEPSLTMQQISTCQCLLLTSKGCSPGKCQYPCSNWSYMQIWTNKHARILSVTVTIRVQSANSLGLRLIFCFFSFGFATSIFHWPVSVVVQENVEYHQVMLRD